MKRKKERKDTSLVRRSTKDSSNKNKHDLCCPAPHRPDLEVDIKRWNSKRSAFFNKMRINETRRLAEE